MAGIEARNSIRPLVPDATPRVPESARVWFKGLPSLKALHALVESDKWVKHPRLAGLEVIELKPEQGRLYRVSPGVRLPNHQPQAAEMTIMLQGGFTLRKARVSEDGVVTAGKERRYQPYTQAAVIVRPPGTADVAQFAGPAGAVLLVHTAVPTKPLP